MQVEIGGSESMKGRLESAEWLNAAVQLVWRRYPLLVAEWLRKDIVDEILEVRMYVYVCMCACVYVRVYICVCVCLIEGECVYVWLNAAVQLLWRRYPLLVAEWLRKDMVDEILEVGMYTYIHTRTHPLSHTHAHMHTYTHTHIRTYAHAHIHT
jgi:hypothetical protein